MKFEKLGKIVKITSGGTPLTSKREYYDGGNIPWVKTGDLKVRHLSNIPDSITQLGLENSSAKIFPTNTVLIAMYGATIGNCSILKKEAATNQACAALLPSEEINEEFLFFFLSNIKQELIRKGVGGGQPNISAKILKEIKIPLPSLTEQKHIADVLSKAEALIAERKQSIHLLDEYLKSTFLEMFGDPVKNEKGWEKKTLNEISVIKGQYGIGASAIDYNKNGYRYIRITDINQNGELNDEFKSPSTPEEENKQYILSNGDLLFARSGATVGKTYLHQEKNGKCIFAGYLIRFRLNPEYVNPIYVYHFTNTNYYWNWIKAKQTVAAQPNVNANLYGNELKIIIPPIPIQNQFAAIVEKTEALKAQYKEHLQSLEQMYGALSQRAFRGELSKTEIKRKEKV